MNRLNRVLLNISKWCAKYKFRNYLGSDVRVHFNCIFDGDVFVGDHSNINGPSYLSGRVKIGKWCAIAYGLKARSSNHATNYVNMQAKLNVRHGFIAVHGLEKGPIRIGNACWIGDDVTLLSGVNIGDGAVVGACSVVTKDVPPFSIAVGNPARVIRTRFSLEVIEALREIRWWDWSDERISRNRAFFEADLTDVCVKNEVYNLLVD
jgi:virginiamycin A acetyltransferase